MWNRPKANLKRPKIYGYKNKVKINGLPTKCFVAMGIGQAWMWS